MKNGNIGLLVIILIVVGTVLVGFYYSAQKEGANESMSRSVEKIVEEEWEDNVCDQQNRGKVENGNYKDELAGFTVRIPVGWKLVEECKDGKLNMLGFEAPDNGELVSDDPKCIPCHNYVRRFDISLYPRDDATLSGLKVNIESAYNNNKDNTVIRRVNKNGLDGYVVTGLVAGGVRSYHLLGKSNRYEIVHTESVEVANVDDPKYTSEFEALINSFREI